MALSRNVIGHVEQAWVAKVDIERNARRQARVDWKGRGDLVRVLRAVFDRLIGAHRIVGISRRAGRSLFMRRVLSAPCSVATNCDPHATRDAESPCYGLEFFGHAGCASRAEPWPCAPPPRVLSHALARIGAIWALSKLNADDASSRIRRRSYVAGGPRSTTASRHICRNFRLMSGSECR